MMVNKMTVFRIEGSDGKVMYLLKLDRAIESLSAAIHHVENMPDSMTIDLNGVDGSRVTVTKPEAQQLLDEMQALQAAEDADVPA